MKLNYLNVLKSVGIVLLFFLVIGELQFDMGVSPIVSAALILVGGLVGLPLLRDSYPMFEDDAE